MTCFFQRNKIKLLCLFGFLNFLMQCNVQEQQWAPLNGITFGPRQTVSINRMIPHTLWLTDSTDTLDNLILLTAIPLSGLHCIAIANTICKNELFLTRGRSFYRQKEAQISVFFNFKMNQLMRTPLDCIFIGLCLKFT